MFDLPALREGMKKLLFRTSFSVRLVAQFLSSSWGVKYLGWTLFLQKMQGLISKVTTDKLLVEIGEIEVLDQNLSAVDLEDLDIRP